MNAKHKRKLPQTAETTAVDLDKILNPTQAAKWLGMSRRAVLDNIRRKRIPAVIINDRVIRIHPRTVLASQGVKLD